MRTIALILLIALLAPPAPGSSSGVSLKARKYYVRIALVKGARKLAVKTSGAYRVLDSDGKPGPTLSSDKLYFAEVSKATPSGRVFRLVMHELDAHEEDRAFELGAAVEKTYKLPIKIMRSPPKDGQEEKLIVAAGEFPTKQAALARAGEIKTTTVWRVLSDSQRGKQGRVSLLDAEGKEIAFDESGLKLEPLNLERSHFHVQAVSDARRSKAGNLNSARPYRGQIELAVNGDGLLVAVNHLWIEHYLYGVVAAEMGDSYPLEALKAQAVVARSEIVAKIERGIAGVNPLFDFDDAAFDRAYSGKSDETSRIKIAVDSTVGEILVWNGDPIQACYSHSCGGVLASAEDIWRTKNQGYFRRNADRLRDRVLPELAREETARDWTRKPVACFCNPSQPNFPNFAAKNFRWVVTLTADALSLSANKYSGVGKVKDVAVVERSPSGRVRRLKIVGDKKTVTLDRELAVRGALGGLRSSFITFDLARDGAGRLRSMTIYGAGYGHGVGMCQIGAIMMSKQNYTYRQILGHYFQSVLIRRLYA